MRKLVITQNVTFDGSIELLEDWFDPQLQDDALLAETHRQDAESDALLLGRQTFEDFRSYWPQQSADTTGITDYLNRVSKYVVSSTMGDPGAELDGDRGSSGRADPWAQAPTRQGHRADRQYSLGAHSHWRRPRRRVPAVCLPRRPGPWSAPLPRRHRSVEAAIGGTGKVVPLRHHTAALRGELSVCPGAERGIRPAC